MNFKLGKEEIAVGIILIVLSTFVILSVYNVIGLGWDFTDLYLNGRSLISPAFYHQNLPIITNFYYFIAPSHVYISIVREPLVSVILAILLLIFNNYAVQIYLFLLLVGLFAGATFLSKELDINTLILPSLLFSIYVIQWTVLYTSQEILSIIFSLLLIGLLIKKSAKSGIALALVGLTKYPGLILFPIILLLFDNKDLKGSLIKILKAYILFGLVTLPWLIFNYIYFGNPLISYQLSLTEAVANNTGGFSLGQLFGALLQFPIILIYPIFIFALLILLGKKNEPNKISNEIINATNGHIGYINILKDLSYSDKVIGFFIALSAIGFIMVYNNVGQPERFGYLLYASVAILVSTKLNNVINTKNMRLVLPFISIVLLAYLYVSTNQNYYKYWFYQQEIGTQNVTVMNAVANFSSTALKGCSVVSNAWPFLNYYNITSYESNLFSVNIKGYASVCFNNYQTSHYPIILFKNVGPYPTYCGNNINVSKIPDIGYAMALPPGDIVCQRISGNMTYAH